MLSQGLNTLIEAALTDGVITDQERAIIKKRALLEGYDPDEVDLILNAKLQSMQMQAQNTTRNMDKCPMCGLPIVAGTAQCPQCGYAFRNVAANSSAQQLAAKIEAIEQAHRGSGAGAKLLSLYGMDSKTGEIASVIKNFPIPMGKDDLLEFIISMQTKMKAQDLGGVHLRPAYKAKYQEAVAKAKILFPDDPQFESLYPKKKKGLFGFGK